MVVGTGLFPTPATYRVTLYSGPTQKVAYSVGNYCQSAE